jgi:hypothetical protein
MRRLLALAFASGLAGASVLGCTLLISFDDVPLDGGGAEEASTPASDAGPTAQESSTPSEAAPAFPPPCDPKFPRAEVNCDTARQPICGKRLGSYPAGHDRANDLVTCSAGGATCVQHCPFGCAQMPAGFVDQCDDCNGRANGFYCGRELRGWVSENFDVAVECQNGLAVRGAVCGTNKCASPCTRPEGPFPSCCVP